MWELLAISLTMFRKGLYKYLLVAFIAPILLSFIFFSTFNTSSLSEVISKRIENEEVVFITSFYPTFGRCYPVKVVGWAMVGDYELPILETPRDILVEDVLNFEKVSNQCDEISIPDIVYRYTEGLQISLNSGVACPLYIHKYVDAVIVFVEGNLVSSTYICVVDINKLINEAILYIEEEVTRTTLLWMIFLTLSHIPLIFISISKIYSMIKVEIDVLQGIGVNRSRIVMIMTMAITITSTILIMFLSSLSIVSITILNKILNIFWFSPMPTFKKSVLIIISLVLLEVCATSVAVGLRRVRYG